MDIALSASRIKTAQQCSWVYWCKYKLGLPDKSNLGAKKGTICHNVFELLGDKRHKKHFNLITKGGEVSCSRAVERLVNTYAKKLGVTEREDFEDMDSMIVSGLLYDFFGEDEGKPTEAISEKSFDIKVDDGEKRYRIRGFIDKLFLYSKKRKAIIRDFKSSKQVFKGKEIEDNMQDLMYCLAVKHIYSKYKNRKAEFIFLKFDLGKNLFDEPGKGVVQMESLSDDELEGFEHQLTMYQSYLESFDEEAGKSNYAAEQHAENRGYPKDGTFGGRLQCGREGYKKSKGEFVLDKKGDKVPAYICQYRLPFKYWVILGKDNKVKRSAYSKDELNIKDGESSEERYYEGCPYWMSKLEQDVFDLV